MAVPCAAAPETHSPIDFEHFRGGTAFQKELSTDWLSLLCDTECILLRASEGDSPALSGLVCDVTDKAVIVWRCTLTQKGKLMLFCQY